MRDIHAVACELRLRELVKETTGLQHDLTDDIQITTCDLIGWAYRLAERGGASPPKKSDVKGIEPDPSSRQHHFWGAVWARNRLTHGDADVLELEVSELIVDPSYDSPDLVGYNDPEVDYDSRLVHGPTLRFAKVLCQIPGDQRPDLQPFYNECIAGCRVLMVANRLALMGPPSLHHP